MGINFGKLDGDASELVTSAKKPTRKPSGDKEKPRREKPVMDVLKIQEMIDAAIADKVNAFRNRIDAMQETIDVLGFKLKESEKNADVTKKVELRMKFEQFIGEWEFLLPRMRKRWRDSAGFIDKIEKANSILGEIYESICR